MTVSHVPLTLSRTFHLFLKHGGKISVEVTGQRRNEGIGLEIPATYRFEHKKPSKVSRLVSLIKDQEDVSARSAEVLHIFVKTGIKQAFNSTLHSNLSFLLIARYWTE